MFVSWATTFNKPGGLSLPPTISVEKTKQLTGNTFYLRLPYTI
jgi:hypothetical protein